MSPELPKILSPLKTDFDKYPDQVFNIFIESSSKMPESLSDDRLLEWAKLGLEISAQSVRSWEAATNFYKASPLVVSFMPYNYFQKWMFCGLKLCEESSTLGASYFESSPGAMSKLRTRHIESWTNLGDSLYKGTWKSSALACSFFEHSPILLDVLAFNELEKFVEFLDILSGHSYDLSSECLILGEKIFPLLDEEKEAFLSLAMELSKNAWREVKSFFEVGHTSLPKVEGSQRLKFMELSEKLLQNGARNIPSMMSQISDSLAQINEEQQDMILDISDNLIQNDVLGSSNEPMTSTHTTIVIPEFIKSSPSVLQKLSDSQFRSWYKEGLDIFLENRDAGVAFFKIESLRSESIIESLASGVEFEKIKSLMEMYCCGLAGSEIMLSETNDLVEKNIGWISNETATTEGSTVYLPSIVDKYTSKDKNFAWFKVASTHQIAHLEFGSFIFDFCKPSNLFQDQRSKLEKYKLEHAYSQNDDIQTNDSSTDDEFTGLEKTWLTDTQRFFDLFEDRKLALDIFTVVEGGRLDFRVKDQYKGIRSIYSEIQMDSFKNREDIKTLPAREALVEFLLLLTLTSGEKIPFPVKYAQETKEIAGVLNKILNLEAIVEDSSEATLRIYSIISAIPNEEIPPDDWGDMDFSSEDDEYEDSEELDDLLKQVGMGTDMELRSDTEEDYDSVDDVDYRGDFKPELAQLMTELRMQQQGQASDQNGEPMSSEELQELLENSAELDLDSVQGEIQESSGMFADNLMKEAGTNPPMSPDNAQGPYTHVDEDGGELEPAEPETFVYDEWDFRANDYKPRWCIVRQKMMQEGDAKYYSSTLHEYGTLVTRIRRQFEMMVPEMFRKERRLTDGEDIDIDDVIENIVDIKTGSTPDEKFYWRRNKVQRDVAVAFLLDTSASTAEAIDDGKNNQNDWDAPEDPVEYMVWLRNRRGKQMNRSYKRIIDVEKESMVLLINALEAIGDTYGIYGFSGYGRENVEYYTVKDLQETFTDRVKKRIDRLAPLHATRMGPAIRHTAYKLNQVDAKTKILFLISDGRPQDRGYSREGVEKEYAVHDTRMSLDEAKKLGINSFCLTVDKNGHDYLKTMCSDMGYEILEDISDLPERLLQLYKRLTM
ncbi:MAG: hypothetical protein CL751_04545 [Chloroflexi bacterium]|nr:hypothetical protein [Chloroflexota bacterium]|tara:strand:+ start:2846 stop:6187 length:3342 start_codon:yes stop_codon:yes gene_type:complete